MLGLLRSRLSTILSKVLKIATIVLQPLLVWVLAIKNKFLAPSPPSKLVEQALSAVLSIGLI